ncbi:uncharacterized protein At1g01500 [Cryptomeria japonica]|uniref:uncharacterized protein At1g01500 n=1 Tax=Cryptomeria japonica TaxID=3369 RepID=UPI0027DA8A5F|nr:uncharacterized protein At1g01500 [Cryptomeria japonica]XP_057814421.2 uncharacterized protein At1g01500 [Cryptomeria japonica]XP_057814422.2 uncharacterized protein At1g01500 [Cryptomeria japonica]
MCQLTESFTLLKLIEFYCKSGRPIQQQWFDIKVVCIKIVDACGIDCAPDNLTLHFLPRSSLTDLQINGKKIRPSASAFVTLRRTTNDGNPLVWSFVSTDGVRTTGKLSFEVYVGHETLVCGALDIKKEDSVNNDRQRTWTVECSSALEYPSRWNSTENRPVSFPSIEVYVTGQAGSLPVILTRTEELIARKKRARQRLSLDAIPEGNDYEISFVSNENDATENQEQRGSFMEMDDKLIVMICEAAMERFAKLLEPKEIKCLKNFKLTWLYVGLCLCLAVGFGVSLGLGMGVFLLVIRVSRGTSRLVKNLTSWI